MLKVIVADDMEMIREGIKAMLEQLPSGAGALEIRTASSGAEAVRLMERIPADLLITDIRMPDMDGHRAHGALQETLAADFGHCSQRLR